MIENMHACKIYATPPEPSVACPPDGSRYCEIPLTQGLVAVVDEDLYPRLAVYHWHATVSGAMRGRARDEGQTSALGMHHEIMRLRGIAIPVGCLVYHINKDRTDNRSCNLIVVTRQAHEHAKGLRRAGSSQYRGVTWDKARQMWHAQMGNDGRNYYLGSYATPEQASVAYEAARADLLGPYLTQIFDAPTIGRVPRTVPAEDVAPPAIGVGVCAIPLTRGFVALVDDDLYPLLSAHRWRAAPYGYGRRFVTDGGKTTHLYMHREVLCLRGIALPEGSHVHHRNNNPSDNRSANLTVLDVARHMQLRRMSRTNTSGYTGVNWRKDIEKWQATLSIKGKPVRIGYFSTPEAAADAYAAARAHKLDRLYNMTAAGEVRQ